MGFSKIVLVGALVIIGVTAVAAMAIVSNILTSPPITVIPGNNTLVVASSTLSTLPFNLTSGQTYTFHVTVSNPSSLTLNGVVVNYAAVASYTLSPGNVALNYSYTTPINWIPLEDLTIGGNMISGHTHASAGWPPGYTADIDFSFTPYVTGTYYLKVWATVL